MTNAVASPPVLLRGREPWPLSIAAYRALGEAGLIPENSELLYGFVYTKMSKSPFHSFLVQFLHEALSRVLGANQLLRSEQPLACGDSEPEPDLAVIHGCKEDFRRDHPHTADLIIEISISSHEYDRSKLRAYAMAGVKECWIVLAPEKTIEVYRNPENNEYSKPAIYQSGSVVTRAVLPAFTLPVNTLFGN